MDIFGSWFYWGLGVGIGLPACLILLTEWNQALARRYSYLARPIALMRNYLVPLGAGLLVLVQVSQVPPTDVSVRGIYTVFGFVVLVVLLSAFNVTLFDSAPPDSWRKRIPTIFVDVGRFLLIGIGLAMILSRVWGVRVGGLFTALGVTSVVIGLMLQNSVGQIVSGLFMLFEQPFRIGDWLETPTARGRVVEANWRAVHIETERGLQITPNSVLAVTSFTNLSRSRGVQKLAICTVFAESDPPDRVCALLSQTAAALPECDPGCEVDSTTVGSGKYQTLLTLRSLADEAAAKATFQRWIWYATRRAGLHLDGADDDFSTPERIAEAVNAVVAPALRLTDTERQALLPHARLVRYGAGETIEYAGQVPLGMIFIVAGTVQVTAAAKDATPLPVVTLTEGGFDGVTALTRQPNAANSHAVDEVSAVTIARKHIETLVMGKPLLLADLGRVIDERHHKAAQVLRQTKTDKKADKVGR